MVAYKTTYHFVLERITFPITNAMAPLALHNLTVLAVLGLVQL